MVPMFTCGLDRSKFTAKPRVVVNVRTTERGDDADAAGEDTAAAVDRATADAVARESSKVEEDVKRENMVGEFVN